jgi:hypothetical protein
MLNKNKLKKLSIISTIIITSLLFAVFIIYRFFISADYMVFKVSNITNLYEKVKRAEKETGSLELGEEDINAVIQNYVKKLNQYKKIQVLGVYSTLHSSKINIFVPIKYGIIKTSLFSSGNMEFQDDKVIFTPEIFKVGKIALSKEFVFRKVKGFSSEEITFDNNQVFISKEILPFDLLSLSLEDEKITTHIRKLVLNDTPITTNETTTPASSDKNAAAPAKTSTKQDILKRASRQLNGVKDDIKSAEDKQIISKIQLVVNKMINDPNYAYQNESNTVKAEYGQLPASDRDNIKEAILNNMDTTTMRQIRSTFRL